MKLFFYVPGMRADGHVMENESLGGSETAGLSICRAMAIRGHDVTVFSNTPGDSEWRGIKIKPIGEASKRAPLGENFTRHTMQVPHDALVVQRVAVPFPSVTMGKVNLFSMHDLARVRTKPGFDASSWNCQGVLSVSDWHGDQIAKAFNLPRGHVHTVRNGIDLSLFDREPVWERKFRSKNLVYMARPERGLANLVGDGMIMDKLREIDPEITLSVCFYDNTTEQTEGLYKALFQRCHDMPNVELLGALSKPVLAELLRDSALMVYPVVPPDQHEETSCISVMEAQAAGTPIVACNNGAILETMGEHDLRRGTIISYYDGQVSIQSFVEIIQATLSNFETWKYNAVGAWEYRENYGWDGPAASLEALVLGTLQESSKNVGRLASHLARHSDYFALTKMCGKSTGPKNTAFLKRFMVGAQTALKPGFYIKENQQAIANGAIESVEFVCETSPHYQMIMRQLDDLLKRGPATVLEIGCRAGQFMIGMAANYPDSTFIGVDISPDIIGVARKESEKRGLTNVKFSTKNDGDDFDVAIIAETLEHLTDPGKFADNVESQLIDTGRMIVTMPTGPSESMSWPEGHPVEHVHHFEPLDIQEIWGDKRNFQVEYFAWPGTTQAGERIGGQMLSWDKSESKANGVDFERKLEQQMPRETLSVIMIVKHDAPAVQRTLRSIAAIADEVVIGVDGTTKQHVRHIRDLVQLECPLSVSDVFALSSSPLEQGFGPARNETLDRAKSDWVLWIDSDEELVYQERVCKFLRPNALQGYAIAHHHYSSEPAQILKTDYPTRLFRRSAFRFFGLVHEHPSETVDKVPEHISLMGENISISHTGYTTDAIRLDRFHRNWPLMKREREENPSRTLGKYLFARDLVHIARYEIAAKGLITEQVRGWCNEVIGLYRELVEEKELRLVLECLPYASEAAEFLSQGTSLHLKMEFDLVLPGVGAPPMSSQGPIEAAFIDTNDVRALTGLMSEEKIKYFEEHYK